MSSPSSPITPVRREDTDLGHCLTAPILTVSLLSPFLLPIAWSLMLQWGVCVLGSPASLLPSFPRALPSFSSQRTFEGKTPTWTFLSQELQAVSCWSGEKATSASPCCAGEALWQHWDKQGQPAHPQSQKISQAKRRAAPAG